MTGSDGRSRGQLSGWLGALVAASVILQRSGNGALAGPPVGQPGRWPSWLEGRDPLTAAFALIRMGALAFVCYLVAVGVVGLLLRLVGAARLVALTDRFTVPPLRRLLAGTVSLGLATSTLAGGGLPLLAGRPPAAVAATQAGGSTSTTLPATVTMHRLADAAPAMAPDTGAPPPGVVQPTSTAGAQRWTVEPGDCFWSIAEAVLEQSWGRPPTDAEIVPYWRRLIEANRPSLAHPGDPDLIFPAQVFEVPAP